MYYIYSTIDQGTDIVWRIVRTMQDLNPLAQFASPAEAMDWCRARGYAYELLVENGYDDDWDWESDPGSGGNEQSDITEARSDSRQQRIDRWASDVLNVEERLLLIERWIPTWARTKTQTAQRFAGLVEAARAGRPWAILFVEFSSPGRNIIACTAGLWAQGLGVSAREVRGLIDELSAEAGVHGRWWFNT